MIKLSVPALNTYRVYDILVLVLLMLFNDELLNLQCLHKQLQRHILYIFKFYNCFMLFADDVNVFAMILATLHQYANKNNNEKKIAAILLLFCVFLFRLILNDLHLYDRKSL